MRKGNNERSGVSIILKHRLNNSENKISKQQPPNFRRQLAFYDGTLHPPTIVLRGCRVPEKNFGTLVEES